MNELTYGRDAYVLNFDMVVGGLASFAGRFVEGSTGNSETTGLVSRVKIVLVEREKGTWEGTRRALGERKSAREALLMASGRATRRDSERGQVRVVTLVQYCHKSQAGKLGLSIRLLIRALTKSTKLVNQLHSLYWSIHTKDESKRGTAFAFIFGVN